MAGLQAQLKALADLNEDIMGDHRRQVLSYVCSMIVLLMGDRMVKSLSSNPGSSGTSNKVTPRSSTSNLSPLAPTFKPTVNG